MRISARTPIFRSVPKFLTALALSLSISLSTIPAATASPSAFVSELWPEAQARGVSRDIFEAALSGFSPSQSVLNQTRSQPEFVQTVGAYVERRVTAGQVQTGRRMAAEWRQTLADIQQRWGVQAEVVLAIWGMETNFGSYMGGNNVVHALATLTYSNYRREFFKNELLTALQILTAGHVSPQDMVGSWAGAMGHTQFMPSSFTRYAVDYNGDGRRDIWNHIPDALASTANYLKEHGWRPGETWGYEVRLPAGFDFEAARTAGRLPLREWAQRGVTRAAGQPFPRPDDLAEIYLPAGGRGPVFLLLHNFNVIKRYNNSNSYALAVGHLADRILGAGGFVQSWPEGDTALNREQRMELQNLLNRRGYNVGTADGVIGPRTRAGIMAFQRSAGLLVDGHASGDLLSRLR